MYASTYESPEHDEHAHSRLLFTADGADITDRVRAANGSGVTSRALERGDRTGEPEIRQALAELRDRYARLYGEAPSAVDAFLIKHSFDWQTGRFTAEVREPLGTVRFSP